MRNSERNGFGSNRRTTVFFADTVDVNLDVLAIRSRKPKGDLIREAVYDYLKKHGFDPDKMPIVTLSYPDSEPGS